MKQVLATHPVIGEIFEDRYRIDSEIGTGGFGVVYKGVQLATGQQVAIKVLRNSGTRDAKAIEKRVARLEREMQLCAQLHHPNIVGLIDFGHRENGSVYSVFELVPGRNLDELIAEEGALSPTEARHLMLQVLDALSCAHSQGVIHRDLKPSNIMVISTGTRRNALVLDFGIGVVSDDGQATDYSRLTGTNEVLGTIAYASPEQLLGRSVTPGADLYSWGLVFIECLTGKPAIEGVSLMDLMLKQVGAIEVLMPPALEAHPLGKLLQSVVEKKLENRLTNAKEVMRRLEAINLSDLNREQLSASRQVDGSGPIPRVMHASETLQVAGAQVQVEEGASKIKPPLSDGSEALSGERRQVTVVCVTLDIDSPPDELLDIEEADQLLHAGQELCSHEATRFRGYPAGAMGEQTLFWFGYPSAAEGDARRAAKAALAMSGSVAGISRGDDRKGRLEARIAIHTGLVVSSTASIPSARRIGATMGTTSRIAAKLSTEAAPGEIVVSGSAQKLLRQHYQLTPLSTLNMGGAAGNVQAFRLDGPSSDVRLIVVGDDTEKPMVGRERELELLLQRWKDCERQTGQVVLITGEVGIGKSRLVRELGRRIVGAQHRWLECRCAPEDQNSALHPIVEMLTRTLELTEEKSPAAKLAKLKALLESVDLKLEEAIPLFTQLLEIPTNGNGNGDGKRGQIKHEPSPAQLKEQLLGALFTLFFEMSEKVPLVLVVEDLQWADPTTMDLLKIIVQEISSGRILLLLTARPSFSLPWSLGSALQMQLGRLERQHIRDMVMRFADTGEVPSSDVLDQIVERTDGVPLFVEEVARTIADYKLTSHTTVGGAWASATSEVPMTLRDLLTARIDRLGRAKGVVQIAAALGREFNYEILEAVTPIATRMTLREDLDALATADIIQRRRRVKGQSYAFKHALIRDTAYGSMLKRARQKIHLEIAEVLEGRFSDIARPEQLALHFSNAERYPTAIRYILKAADTSLQRSANIESQGYARQALEWLEHLRLGLEGAELELHTHSVLITALIALTGPGTKEVERHITRAQELLGSVGNSPFAIPTLAKLALYHQMRGNWAEVRSIGTQFLELARRKRDTGAEVAALTTLTQLYFHTADYSASEEAARRALEIYDSEQHAAYAIATNSMDFRSTCRGTLAFVLFYRGYPDQALAEALKGVAEAEELDHANTIAMSLLFLASIHRYRRESRETANISTRLQEMSQRHGLYLGAFAALFLCWLGGDPTAPEQIVAGFRAYGQVFAMPYWCSTIAETYAAAGRWDKAIKGIDACIQEAEALGEVEFLPELLRLKGTFLLGRDSSATDEAEASFRRSIEMSRSHGGRSLELRALVSLASLLRANGRGQEVRSSLQACLSTFTEGLSLPDLQEARDILASG